MSKVLIVMGSKTDFQSVKPAWLVLAKLKIDYDVKISSAHRTPDVVAQIATDARDDGFNVIIAAAGGAAHLAGVIAAHTTLPVVALPLNRFSLGGVDALLSSVQMPPGVPLASVGIDAARNAGLFAARIVSTYDESLVLRLEEYRQEMAEKVNADNADYGISLRFPSS